ncbi:MAG TPA: formate dehydrogenase accessory protein FdhE [Pyrinomonadaceae bacterium]|nr:formate dehydrogenase accessory protein FdhE [Pyrinomonadaceae bacterium]
MVWQTSTNTDGYQWDAAIRRAEHLAAEADATKELLNFYAELLRAQKEIYERLRGRKGWLPSGLLEDDLTVVRRTLPRLLGAVESSGPAALAEESRSLARAGDGEVDRMILEEWRTPSGTRFFAKALLQPYARWLAESGGRPFDRELGRGGNGCPFCGGRPQVSLLRTREPSADGGGRELLCATCLGVWPFGRVLCAGCGEQRPASLGYFHTPEYEHIRIEACDTCKRYIKGVDLTRLGLAVPLVDEVAAAPLDVWAHEHGYSKIELNLVGL